MKKLVLIALHFFCLLLMFGCASRPKNGDLIFVTAKTENLSGAISRVTRQDSKFSFDHVGIVRLRHGRFTVLHAAPKDGSQEQKLADFLAEVKSCNQRAALYRLKKNYRNTIPGAMISAEKMLGRPYNFSYILNENSFYCSDFVERAFRGGHIFNLEPMTFKDKETGKVDDYWQKYYKNLGIAIPEGNLGCNPNGLSHSDKIFFVKFIK